MTAAALASLLALPAPAVAQDDELTWDPEEDRGVPEEQLLRDAERKPTASAPGAGAAEESTPPREDPELIQTRRARDRRGESATRPAEAGDAGDAAHTAVDPLSTPAQPFDPNAADERQGRRIQLFLIPVGENAGMVAHTAQLALERELARIPGFSPVDLVRELEVPPSPAELDQLEAARTHVVDGNVLMGTHDYGEAVHRYRKALQTLSGAGIAMQPADYVDVSARLGTALLLAGEEQPGRAALRNAVRNDPYGKLVPGDLPSRGLRGLDDARNEVSTGPTGALSFVTAPAGARVFVAGVYRGTTPLTLDTVPAGPVVVRLDRPGAFPWVQVVEARQGHDTPVKVRMSFTPEAVSLQRMLVEVPRDLDRQRGMPAVVRELGSRFRLDRGVIAIAQMNATNSAGVRLAVFDYGGEVRLADERASFALDVAGGLEPAIAAWARTVFDKADASRNRSAADPLDRIDGTERWYTNRNADDRDDEKKKDDKKRKSSGGGDPLSSVDGTEDW